MRTRVRIGPHHPLVCRKRRLNEGGPSDETGKTEVPCHSRCGTIFKDPSILKALSTEHRPKFGIYTPAMVTSPPLSILIEHFGRGGARVSVTKYQSIQIFI
jgi:hypothetical protein